MSRLLRIAFVLPGGGPSGGVRASVVIANGLVERGHAVRILYHKASGFRALIRNAVRDTFYAQAGNWLSQLTCDARPFSAIEREAFSEGEIVVGMGLWACAEVAKVRKQGVLKVHYLHGGTPWDGAFMKSAWSERIPKIAVASYLEKTLDEVCGQKIAAVVPNGVDTQEYYPTTTDGQRDGVGTIFGPGFHKDPETTLTVLKTLRQVLPQVPLRVFSSAGRPQGLDVDEYVKLPSVAQAREIYSRSRVWLLCSRSEGFGMPILEAMACGCAVVATDCGGPADIIGHGENGFLVDVGDVDQIVEKVRVLMTDTALCQSLAERGHQTVEKFSWDQCVEKLESALRGIAADVSATSIRDSKPAQGLVHTR